MTGAGIRMSGVGHNRSFPGTENPAYAGFLIGDYRPQLAVPEIPVNGNYAATPDVHVLQSVLTLSASKHPSEGAL